MPTKELSWRCFFSSRQSFYDGQQMWGEVKRDQSAVAKQSTTGPGKNDEGGELSRKTSQKQGNNLAGL